MNSLMTWQRLKALILLRLARKRKWGHSHTAFENLVKGVPSEFRGDARRAADELVREGLVRVKPTSYGRHVSLNENKCEEIKEAIRRYFGNAV